MRKTFKTILAAALSAALLLLVACGEEKPPVAESASMEPDASYEESAVEGIQEDGRGILLDEADFEGEWLYEGQGCIITFDGYGECVVDYEGSIFSCTYGCDGDTLVLSYDEPANAVGELHENGMLYFDGSSMGFMPSWMWSQDGWNPVAEDFLGTWVCQEDYCVFTIMDDMTFVLEDKFGVMQGGVLWNEDGYMELCADEGAIMRVDLYDDNTVTVDGYDGFFLYDPQG